MKMETISGSRLAGWHKTVVLGLAALLAASGLAWMAWHYTLVAAPQFDGPAARHGLHLILIAHGVLGYGAAILIGSLLGRHVPVGLKRPRKPWSGIVALSLCGVLVVSALFLYYAPTLELHDAASLVHQLTGAAVTLAVWRHVAVWGRSRR
jgi:dolichol kinase